MICNNKARNVILFIFQSTIISIILYINEKINVVESVEKNCQSLFKWKLPYISENFLHNIHTNIPILGISESWLKSYITDGQLNIKDYVPIRSDRSIRKGGGAILYIHEKIPISDEDHFDDITCQASLCILQTISTILINVYRPPKSSSKSFSNLLKHVQSYLEKHINVKHYDINILGDFNFPILTEAAPTVTAPMVANKYWLVKHSSASMTIICYIRL